MEYIAMFDDTLELSLIYEDENILEMTLEETVNPGDDFELGAAPSSLLEVSLIDADEGIIFEQEVIKPYVGLVLENTIEYVPLGVFVVDDIKKEKRTIKLVCFDNMIKLEKPYFSELTYPAPISAVAQEICTKAGVTLATTLPDTQIGDLSGYTLREAIGFIAAFMGGFARFNRDGQLEITSYADSGVTITADNYASLDTAERAYSVGRLTCYAGEDANGNPIVLTAGATGHEVIFECPIMTQEQLDSIYSSLSQISYMPFNMEWQGNPALVAGDKITIIDAKGNVYSTLLMRQKIIYKGSVKATAEAVGKTEQAQATRTIGTLTKSIDRKTQIARTAAEQYADRILKMLADGEFEGGLFIDGYTLYSPVIAGLQGRFLGTVKIGENGQIVIDGQNKRIYLNETNYWDETGIHVSSANIVGSITFAQLDSTTQTNINKGVAAKDKIDADVGTNTIETTVGAQAKATTAESNAKTYADDILSALANGQYTGGTFINGKSVISPVIAGLEGRFTGEVKVGVGNDLAGISGEGTDANSVRFWAGHADKTQAPFKVMQNGALVATDVTISGIISAIGDIHVGKDLYLFRDYVNQIGGAIYFGIGDPPASVPYIYAEQRESGGQMYNDLWIVASYGDLLLITNKIKAESSTLNVGNLGVNKEWEQGALDVAGDVYVNGRKIVDYGSNTNGSYIRFADGTQICWYRFYIGNKDFTTQTVPPAVYGGSSYRFTYPAPFINTPTVFANAESNGYLNSMATGVTTTECIVRIWSNYSISMTNVAVSYIAIGRWV